MAIEQLTAGVDRLTLLLEHRKRYFRLITGALFISLALNFGTIAVALSVKSANGGAECRASARVEWDQLRDDRDNLQSDGLLAIYHEDVPEQVRVDRELTDVRHRIEELGPLRRVFHRAGCD